MGPIRSHKRFRQITGGNHTMFNIIRMSVGRRRAGSIGRPAQRGTSIGNIILAMQPVPRTRNQRRIVLSVNLSARDYRSQVAVEIANSVFRRNQIAGNNNETFTGDNWLSKLTSNRTIREINPPLVAKPAKKRRATTRRPRGTVRN